MSGPGIGGGAPEIPEVECTRISERTILNSPDQKVVGRLKQGDVLNVEIYNGTSLVAVTEDSEIAGALTPPLLPRIVECMEEGFEYVAVVLNVSGGECRVHVKLRSKA